jgi:hypothetical protein
LTKLDTHGNTLGEFDVTAFGTRALAFDGENIWAANGGNADFDGSVDKLRASDGTLLDSLTVVRSPFGLYFDGANMWVTDGGFSQKIGRSVTKIQVSDDTVLGTFTTGANPAGVVVLGNNVWTACTLYSSLYRLRATDGTILANYSLDRNPVKMVAAGKSLWITCPGDGLVDKITPLP